MDYKIYALYIDGTDTNIATDNSYTAIATTVQWFNIIPFSYWMLNSYPIHYGNLTTMMAAVLPSDKTFDSFQPVVKIALVKYIKMPYTNWVLHSVHVLLEYLLISCL